MSEKVYISGQISGLSRPEAAEYFETAENLLLLSGMTVVNPLRNGVPVEAPWEDHMIVDIANLMACDSVYLLRNWENSRGARIEYNIAREMGKKIYLQTL